MSMPPPPPPGGNQFPPPPPLGNEGGWSSGPYGGAPGTYPGAAAPSGYASWGSRVGATLLRGLAGVPAYIPVWIGAAMDNGLGLILMIVGWALGLAVQIRLYIQRGHLGTDVGDAVVGQRLVREATGAPMGSGWSIWGRSLLHILDALPFYLGFLWPLWDAKRQTFADKILNTVVVQTPSTHSSGDLFRNAYEFWKPVTKA